MILFSPHVYANCPSHYNEWNEYIQRSVLVPGSYFMGTGQFLERLLQCDRDPVVLACTRRLEDFLRAGAVSEVPGHKLGLTMPDDVYFKNPPLPGIFDPPSDLLTQDILRLVNEGTFSHPETLDRIVAKVQSLNPSYRAVPYQVHSPALSLDSPTTMGRFLIYVPGDKFDQFFQLSMNDGTEKEPVSRHQFSVVAIQKKDKEGKQLIPPVAYFKDHWRVHKDGKIFLETAVEQQTNKKCYECHASGAIQIHPASIDPKYSQSLREINFTMGKYSNANIAGINREHFGPPLGPVDSHIRDQPGFMQCASTSDEASIARIKQAMNCSFCHSNLRRGGIYSEPFGTMRMMIYYIQKLKTMPPGHAVNLTQSERAGLIHCLLAENQKAIEAWAYDPACLTQFNPNEVTRSSGPKCINEQPLMSQPEIEDTLRYLRENGAPEK